MEKSIREESNSKLQGDCTAGNFFLGLTWPPRSYTCSFCKREFRSAQALGGHMNVHRRDRARLRESPPWEPPTKKDHPRRNPNRVLLLNLNSEPERMHDDVDAPAALMPTSPLCLPSRLSSSTLKASSEAFSSELQNSKNRMLLKAVEEVSETKEHPGKDPTCRALKRKNGARGLQLETGIKTTVSENLDLDLRLGYP